MRTSDRLICGSRMMVLKVSGFGSSLYSNAEDPALPVFELGPHDRSLDMKMWLEKSKTNSKSYFIQV